MEDAEYTYKLREDKLKELRANGPSLNGTAPSYRPRMWDAIALGDGEQQFMTAVDWLKSEYMKHGATIDTPEAARIAKEMHSTLQPAEPDLRARRCRPPVQERRQSRFGPGPYFHHPR